MNLDSIDRDEYENLKLLSGFSFDNELYRAIEILFTTRLSGMILETPFEAVSYATKSVELVSNFKAFAIVIDIKHG